MKVFITTQIPDPGIDLLKKKGYQVILNKKKNLTENDIIKNAKDADAILCPLSVKISDKIINECANLKIIANYSVGYNNINVEAATERKIAVTNTPGVLTDSTADIAILLMLSVSRRIIESMKLLREGKFTGWDPMLLRGMDMNGKTLGIIGAGRIGQAVAKRANAFGMKILYYNRSKSEFIESELKGKKCSLNALLQKSDYISLHIPLTPDTFHFLGKEELSLLKPGAIIINTARGEVIDEKELIKLLKSRKIYGAGFDVFEGEPVLNPDLLKLENVMVLPHIGSATIETRDNMSLMAAQNIIEVLSNRKPKNIVNKQIYG